MNFWGSDVILLGPNFGCHSGILKYAKIVHFIGFSTAFFAHKSLNSEKWLEVIYPC